MDTQTKKYEPLVSIALATYNGEKYLTEQLDSLLSQTYQNFEIIVSDDNSADSTYSILEEYAKKDKRIYISKNKGKNGFISNFSEAIQACRGEVIFLCDQDDFWYKEKLAKHVDEYKNPDVGWVYNQVVITDENRQKIGYLTDTLPGYWTRRNLLYYTWGSCVLGCATSYRKRHVEKIWPADINAPGHDSWIQLAIYPVKSAYVGEVLQDYRQHSSNVVGLKIVPDEKIKEIENLAILNNLNYLKSLSRNRNLQLWKNLYFLVVYNLKIIRKHLR